MSRYRPKVSLFRKVDDLAPAPLVGTLPDAGAFAATGTTAEIAALRPRPLDGPAPCVASKGDARASVERDADGRPWLFASADDLAGPRDSLLSLRYYANQSFISVGKGARPTSGRWPVTDSAMRRVLERGPE